MKFFRLALHPTPEPGQADTSLRYTDILFGFVIRELFLRIQNWTQLNWTVRLHLIVGAILVLGSWIGFRRSLNRPRYEAKFFNLPLFMFIVDQVMLVLYFRIAVLAPADGKELPLPDWLARTTIFLVVCIFALYVVWDLLGIWMAYAPFKDGSRKNRYPKLGSDGKLSPDQTPGWPGFVITAVSVPVFLLLWRTAGCWNPNWLLLVTAALLLGYRWAKEIRTSWRS